MVNLGYLARPTSEIVWTSSVCINRVSRMDNSLTVVECNVLCMSATMSEWIARRFLQFAGWFKSRRCRLLTHNNLVRIRHSHLLRPTCALCACVATVPDMYYRGSVLCQSRNRNSGSVTL